MLDKHSVYYLQKEKIQPNFTLFALFFASNTPFPTYKGKDFFKNPLTPTSFLCYINIKS